jgi:hypothetical protein
MQYFRVLSRNYIPKPACRGYTIQPPARPQDPEEKSRKGIG